VVASLYDGVEHRARRGVGRLVGSAPVLGEDRQVVAAAESLTSTGDLHDVHPGVQVRPLDDRREFARGVDGDGVAPVGAV